MAWLIGRIKRLNPRLLTLAETGARVEEVSLPIRPETYTRLLAVIQDCPYVLVGTDQKGYVVEFVAAALRHPLEAELRGRIEEASAAKSANASAQTSKNSERGG